MEYLLAEEPYKLIAYATKTRYLSFSSIFETGTISNISSNGGPEDNFGQYGRGYSCIIEKRTVKISNLEDLILIKRRLEPLL